MDAGGLRLVLRLINDVRNDAAGIEDADVIERIPDHLNEKTDPQPLTLVPAAGTPHGLFG